MLMMMFDMDLNEILLVFSCREVIDDDGKMGIEVFGEFSGNVFEYDFCVFVGMVFFDGGMLFFV